MICRTKRIQFWQCAVGSKTSRESKVGLSLKVALPFQIAYHPGVERVFHFFPTAKEGWSQSMRWHSQNGLPSPSWKCKILEFLKYLKCELGTAKVKALLGLGVSVFCNFLLLDITILAQEYSPT